MRCIGNGARLIFTGGIRQWRILKHGKLFSSLTKRAGSSWACRRGEISYCAGAANPCDCLRAAAISGGQRLFSIVATTVLALKGGSLGFARSAGKLHLKTDGCRRRSFIIRLRISWGAAKELPQMEENRGQPADGKQAGGGRVRAKPHGLQRPSMSLRRAPTR